MTAVTAQQGGARAGAVRWRMVWLTFAVVAVSFLDRNNISIAASAIEREFAIGNVPMGWVFSAFLAGYALAQPLAGRLADRLGPRRVIAAGIVWWSLLTAATALVPAGHGWSLAALMAVRFALGLGEAVIFPAGSRLVANWLPGSERGFANGIIFAGVGVGAGVAPPLITAIILGHDWHWAFYASAAIGLVAGVVWLAVVRDRPEQSAACTPAERAYIAAGTPAGARADALGWSRILANRTLQVLCLCYFAYGYVAYIFFTWFFKYLSGVRGLNLASSGHYAILPFLAMALASPGGGWLSDRVTARWGARLGRCGTAAAAMALAAGFVAIAPLVADIRVATLCLAGGAGALYLSQSAFWTLSAGLGGGSAGAVSGVMNMANQIGGVITASLTPLIAGAFGWTASFLFAAGLCLCGAAAWLLVDPDDRLETPQ